MKSIVNARGGRFRDSADLGTVTEGLEGWRLTGLVSVGISLMITKKKRGRTSE